MKFVFLKHGLLFLSAIWLQNVQTQDSLTSERSKEQITNTEDIRPNQSLHLSFIEINEEFVDFNRLSDPEYRGNLEFRELLHESFDSIAPYYNYPIDLDLPYELNTLSFHVAAIDWKSPHSIEYSYNLKGLNDEWSVPSSMANFDFDGLSHGAYVLNVRARGEDGIWSLPISYSFRIRAPWYMSVWAYLIYTMAFIGVCFSGYRYAERRRLDQEKIERLLAQNKLLSFADTSKRQPRSNDNGFLDLVNQILELHLSDENFGIAELCEHLKMSRSKLHRKLKSLTGQSTSHYIRSLRLDIAKGMLEKTDFNVSEVAFSVGFSSLSYFSRVFKEEFGFAPKELL